MIHIFEMIYYNENPNTHRKILKATWQQQKGQQNYDYTTIADRLRTVLWSTPENVQHA